MSSGSGSIVSVEFEVFGRVQGVYFRKHTLDQGQRLGLRGWCMNTDRGTVIGVVQGHGGQVETMKRWLRHTGSPQSEIDNVVFKNEQTITEYSFQGFTIRQ